MLIRIQVRNLLGNHFFNKLKWLPFSTRTELGTVMLMQKKEPRRSEVEFLQWPDVRGAGIISWLKPATVVGRHARLVEL